MVEKEGTEKILNSFWYLNRIEGLATVTTDPNGDDPRIVLSEHPCLRTSDKIYEHICLLHNNTLVEESN